MKKDLLIALRRHKRLIVLFLLTIFLPSVLLSILGIKAIRNERFRQAKQLEEKQIGVIDLFKTQILSQINEVENALQYFAQTAENDSSRLQDEALFSLGRVYSKMGQLEKSKDAFQKIADQHPDSMYTELIKEVISG